jgi:hypothetical protein
MRAGKAYLSSLGTTGVLIASSLLLLTVVGALVGFNRWPTQAAAEPDTVAIAPGGTPHAIRLRSGYLFVAPGAVRLAGTVSGSAAAPRATTRLAAATSSLQTGAATATAPAGPGVSMQPAPVGAPRPPAPPPAPAPAPAAEPVRADPSAADPGADVPSPDGLGDILPSGGTTPGDGGRLTEVAGEVQETTGSGPVTPLLGHVVELSSRR